MIESEFKQLIELSAKRNEKLYAWLRWLVLLAAGFFSVMVGQLAGKHFDPAQQVLLKIALGLTAAGILSGSAAAYGEVSALRQLALEKKEWLQNILQGTEVDSDAPIAAEPAWILRQAEKLCYASLICALVSWVAFVAVANPT